jgi:hypothetical protein
LPPVPRRTPCIADDHSATTAAYRRGCSCDAAREAWRRDRADYNARRRDPGYRGIRGGGPTLPVTPTERAQRMESLRARNQRLAVGARRKLRALLRGGYGRAYLARRLALTPARLSAICGGSSGSGIWPKTARAVEELFQELRYTLGDNDATRNNAERLGYLPAHAWNGVDIDDPAALPRWRISPGPRSATA